MPSSVNAPGTPGYNPAWYSLANTGVYWDPANLSGTASDSNSGAASVSAVRSWNEIIRRFGSDSPLQTPGKNIIINKPVALTGQGQSGWLQFQSAVGRWKEIV